MTQPPAASAAQPASKRTKISQGDIPSYSLEKALRVPQAIANNYASQPTRPIDVATALDFQPSSGGFRGYVGASIGYGLTDGGANAPAISLTALGRRVVIPTEEGDDRVAQREAALKPTIARQFYGKYDGSPLPPKTIAQNVLATMSVPNDRTATVYDLLIENARFVGFLKAIGNKEYIDTGSPVSPAGSSSAGSPPVEEPSDPVSVEPVVPAEQVTPPHEPEVPPANRNAIFVGHGGNRKPADQLVKILNEYGIPHKLAVEEANRARPIPQKVADTMRECGAAILVFTADKEYFDADHNSIWRPSENVSHELGAASVLYGERIVVFKEAGIDLPSNFSSVGYIEFEKDKLSDKGIDLFRELVTMKILNISVG